MLDLKKTRTSVAVLIVLLGFMAASANAATLSPGNLLVGVGNRVYEYRTDGTWVQSIPTVYPGGYPVTEHARDVAANKSGQVHIYNGTFSPWMSTYDTLSSSWTHLTHPGFSTVANGTYGGIDINNVFADTVFATDMYTGGGGAKGVVAFNTSTSQAQRFATGTEPIDLTMGLDGLLYTLSPGGSPGGTIINVYDASTFAHIRSIDLRGIFGWTEHRSIAVDYNGDIFIADWDGDVQRVDRTGKFLDKIDVEESIYDVDISKTGELAVGTRFGKVFMTDTDFSSTSSFQVGGGAFVEFVPLPTPTSGLSVEPAAPDGVNGWRRTLPLITLGADDPATIFYSWTGEVSPTAYTTPFYPRSEGRLTLRYHAAATLVEREAQLDFWIDSGPPTNPDMASSQAKKSWSLDQTANISLSGATDTISGVDGYSFTWSKDNTETPDAGIDAGEGETQLTSQFLDEGDWYFNLRTRDKAGNWTLPVSRGPIPITRPLRLSAGTTDESEPVFAGAEKIVYVVYDSDASQSDVWVMNRDGSGKTNLTNTPDRNETNPDYSVGAGKIAYAGWESSTSVTDIWTMGLDGSGKTNITSSTVGDEYEPSFSPAGDKIAFTYWNPIDRTEDIFLMKIDGSGRENLTRTPRDSEFSPAFSPGGKIAYATYNPVYCSDVWTMDSDGSAKTNLTNTWFIDEYSPAYTPSGDRLAYTVREEGELIEDQWWMAADGTDRIALSASRYRDESNAAFSPDRQSMVFQLRDYRNSPGIDLWLFQDEEAPTAPSLAGATPGAGEAASTETIEVKIAPSADSQSGFRGYASSWSRDTTELVGEVIDTDAGQTRFFSGPLAEGSWYLNLKPIDKIGNWGPVTHLGPFTIDVTDPTNPTITSPNPIGELIGDDTIRIDILPDASDAVSGVAGYSLSWTEATTAAPEPVVNIVSTGDTSESMTSTPLGSGTWFANLSTVDRAGNWTSTTHLGPFLIDKSGPSGSITVDSGSAYSRSRKVTLDLRATDSGGAGVAEMRLKDDAGSWRPWEPYARTKAWTLPAGDGVKRVWAQFRDEVGNPSPATSDTIQLDTRAPAATVATSFISTRLSKTTTFRVRWSETDPAPSSGLRHFTVRYRPSTSSTWRTWKKRTSTIDGLFAGKAGVSYYFRVRVIDNAGNSGWSKVRKAIVPFNEGIFYSRSGFNGYQTVGVPQSYLSSVRYSYLSGHTLVYKLYKTNGIGLVVTKGPNMGRAKIYVDGKYVTTVDAHKSTKRARQLIYYKGFSKKGTHFLKVVNLGTPGRARFEVDGVVVGR